MTTNDVETRTNELIATLGAYGRPAEFDNKVENWRDYVADSGVTPDDIPVLMRLARDWLDRTEWPEGDESVFYSVHAWRALAQVGDEKTVPFFLDLLDPLDKVHDDWFLEDFSRCLSLIGPAALPSLERYLAEDHRDFAKVAVTRALSHIGTRHAEAAGECIAAAGRRLREYESNTDTVNTFLIDALMDLKGTSEADAIERAFAADRVDVTVAGNWDCVSQDMGIEGQGLVPKHLAEKDVPLISPEAIRREVERQRALRIRNEREQAEKRIAEKKFLKKKGRRKKARKNRKKKR